MIDLTWAVAKDVIGWAASAQQTAKTKQHRRLANVVEHAGVLTAGVTRLNGQVVAMLKPLVYFEPSEWDLKSRAELARDLVLFSEESSIVPRMRSSRSSLRLLIIDIDDPDVSMPLNEILSMADALFPVDNVYGRSGVSPSPEDSETTVLLNSAGIDLYGPDSILVFSLPTLLTLIRSAETKSDVAELRHLAAVLTDIDLDRLGYPRSIPRIDLHSPIEQLSNRSVLAPYAAAMQAAFGRLIAAQQRVFPAMPSPAWAY